MMESGDSDSPPSAVSDEELYRIARNKQVEDIEELCRDTIIRIRGLNGHDPDPVILRFTSGVTGIVSKPATEKKVYFEVLTPSQVGEYNPPPGTVLIGDNHVVRGGVSIIGGAPGVGKSRLLVAMAEAGATQYEWLGQPVHSKFKMLIIQNENGRYRMKMEFSSLNKKLLDDYLRISPPPAYGLRFDKLEFRDQVRAVIDEHQPSVIGIDPWNAVSRDDKIKDYRETFDLVRDVIPAGDQAPHVIISAHTRKPLPNERTSGRALLNLLSGSHVLASVPRCVWVLQHASDDVSETRVVVTCCKNNDGELGPRSVWIRDNGLWTRVENFDWQAWDKGEKEEGFTSEKVPEILEKNPKGLPQSKLASEIVKRGVSVATAYRRIEQAEKSRIIKYQKALGVYTLP